MHAIRGSIHQGQVQCRGQGYQCSLIAVTARLAFYCGVRLYELKRKFSRPDCVRWKSIVR